MRRGLGQGRRRAAAARGAIVYGGEDTTVILTMFRGDETLRSEVNLLTHIPLVVRSVSLRRASRKERHGHVAGSEELLGGAAGRETADTSGGHDHGS